MASFDSEFKHWPTLGAFVTHLATVPRPAWLRKLVVHNTYIPNEAQWRGLASMEGMRRVYIAKGWSAGPHLFLAAECLTFGDRGIWQMTPLRVQGVHAGPCNSTALGIENVADWQDHPPTTAQHQLLLDVLALLCRSWKLTAGDVLVHKECMAGRTCPGQYMPAEQLRDDLRLALAPPADPWLGWGTAYPLDLAQRTWGIPQCWLKNQWLGQARSREAYEPDGQRSVQWFQNGWIVYEKLVSWAMAYHASKEVV